MSSTAAPARNGSGGLADYDFSHGRELGAGNFGRTVLATHLPTGDLVAVKMIPRGERCDRNVEREVLNQRALSGVSPFVVSFREAFLTPEHLCIAMEYCSGGEIFLQVAQRGRLPEREARRLFRQLVSGVAACHAAGVAHRDLKLENALLGDGAVLKIADFGYSKRMAGDSGPPVSRVGTPSYIAPEVLICGGGGGGGQQEVGYDGRAADVWSLGVFLYVLVVGAYPFEPPVASPSPPAPLPPPPAAAAADGQQSPGQAPDPSPSPPPPPPPQRNVVEVVRRILAAKYGYPPGLSPSAGCADLIARVLVADPRRRLPLEAVRAHPWFLGIRGGGGEGEGDDPLPADVAEDPAMAVARARQREQESGAAEGASRRWQTEDEVREVVAQARGLGREPRGLATATVTVAGGGGK